MEVTSSNKQIWYMGSYAMQTLAIMVGMMYLNTFATEVLNIPTSTLATALLIAKSIDFAVSIFAGAIIEKIKISNKGKYQSWLYVGRWAMFIACAIEVANTSTAPMFVRVAVMSIAYTIINCLMNLVQTAYYGLVSLVAGPNQANRNAMTVNMTRQLTVTSLISAFIPTLVTKLPFGNWNYFVVAVVFAIPMLWALKVVADQGEGLDKPVDINAGTSTISLKDMIDTIIKNKEMLVLFIGFTVYYTAYYIFLANYTYYFIYVLGDFGVLTICNLIGSLMGLIAAFVMPKLSAKIGKKWSTVTGFVISGIGMGLMTVLAPNGWVYYMICNILMLFGQYTWTPFTVTLYLDAGEYYLYQTGKDTRSIAAGLATPPMKIGIAAGGSIGLFLLTATGFSSGMAVTSAWISSFMKVSFLLPASLYIVAALVIAIGYKITDKKASFYALENFKKMGDK